MKSRATFMVTLIIGSLLIPACAGAIEQVSNLEISFDDFQISHSIERAIEVDAGDTFEISLFSNRTTGFQWPELAGIADSSIINQISHEYKPPESDLPGASGKEIWIFKAIKKGITSISMKYDQPWDGGIKAEWGFSLEISVK